jgi:iron complex transport system substrate-binding protein
MPIVCPIRFRKLTEEEFRKLDYEVMGHAFASQSELGRLCDEVVYRNDLAARLGAARLAVQTQVPISVSHKSFRKLYYLDLVVEEALIYELRSATAMTGEHQRQLLTYLLLVGLRSGKLVNFRPPSVEYLTVNAVLSHDEQRRFDFVTARWLQHTERDQLLVATLTDLLSDWGAFLEMPLYRAGLVHFLGGEAGVYRDVPVTRAGITLGTTRLPMLDEHTAFRLTAVTDEDDIVETHLHRLLHHTPLRRLHWINFNHHRIELVTLCR